MRTIELTLVSLAFLLSTTCCSKDSIPGYTEKLRSSVAHDRNEAAMALGRCGPKAASAVWRLQELLDDSNTGVQSAAAYALREIDTPAARAALKRAEAARHR